MTLSIILLLLGVSTLEISAVPQLFQSLVDVNVLNVGDNSKASLVNVDVLSNKNILDFDLLPKEKRDKRAHPVQGLFSLDLFGRSDKSKGAVVDLDILTDKKIVGLDILARKKNNQHGSDSVVNVDVSNDNKGFANVDVGVVGQLHHHHHHHHHRKQKQASVTVQSQSSPDHDDSSSSSEEIVFVDDSQKQRKGIHSVVVIDAEKDREEHHINGEYTVDTQLHNVDSEQNDKRIQTHVIDAGHRRSAVKELNLEIRARRDIDIEEINPIPEADPLPY